MNRRWGVAAVMLLVALAGCPHRNGEGDGPTLVRRARGPAQPGAAPETKPAIQPAGYTRDPNDPFQTEAYVDPDAPASIPDYKVEPNFANVGNWAKFAPVFTADQKQMLQQNLFLVLPADRKQMSFIYEENNYTKGKNDQEIPSFVTTDSVLHTFHVFYDYLLRVVEDGKLYDACALMSQKLADEMVKQYNQAADADSKKAALADIAYLLVPLEALGRLSPAVAKSYPAEAVGLAETEWKLIQAHEGKTSSPILGVDVDYSMFVPRGHYTRSEKLKRYFVAMMWYGTAPFQIRDESGKTRPEAVREAYLFGKLLTTPAASTDPNAPGILWRRIYEPTAFMVGVSDDMIPSKFAQVADEAAAGKPLTDAATCDKVVDETAKKNPRQIVNGKQAQTVEIKLMGQRFVLDSYILQQLLYPSVGNDTKPRGWPIGLDLMSAFGNDRALDILKTDYKQAEYANYESQMQAMRDYVKAVPADQWQANIYWGWMDILRRQVEAKPTGYPSFMRTAAWQDRQLNGALGSWAELRHDTILYAHQVTAECGEGGEDEKPKPPKGYVEPDVRVYARLKHVLNQLWKGLHARAYLNESLEEKCRNFDELLGFLVSVSKKELANQPLTKEEEETLHNYGDHISMLNMFTMERVSNGQGGTWSEISSDTDRDMAVVADIHTSVQEQQVLEIGAGHANAIYAVFPARGKLWIGRGAVFSYYEFKHPQSDRLTDEQWQKILASPKKPDLQPWVKSFMDLKEDKSKKKIQDRLIENATNTGGC